MAPSLHTTTLEATTVGRHATKAGPRISLAMIVRNEAAGLERCLLSAAAAVDEIVIVDTGSSDETKAISRRFTDHVRDFSWVDDFSAARQYAFDACSGEWILWLDGDDEVAGALTLKEACSCAPAEVGALECKYITGMDTHGNVTQEFWRERCVRRGRYRWEGRVHEVLVPAGQSSARRHDGLVVTHHGKPAAGTGGLQRNVRILTAEVERQGGTVPRTLFYLARDTMQLGDLPAALDLLERYLAIATWDEEAYFARLLVARIHLQWANYLKAAAAALVALDLWPLWPDAHFLLAEIAYYRKQWRRVIAWCDSGRSLPPPRTALFFDPLNYSFRWIIYYTNALCREGLVADALTWTIKALAIVPDDVWHVRNRGYLLLQLAKPGNGGEPRGPLADAEHLDPAAGRPVATHDRE